jgi:hypothetical protein
VRMNPPCRMTAYTAPFADSGSRSNSVAMSSGKLSVLVILCCTSIQLPRFAMLHH